MLSINLYKYESVQYLHLTFLAKVVGQVKSKSGADCKFKCSIS